MINSFTERNSYLLEGITSYVDYVLDNGHITSKLRIAHISHLDLDGYGSTLLTDLFCNYLSGNGISLTYFNINHNRLLDTISKLIESVDKFDLVIITDLALTDQMIDMIDSSNINFLLFDHHVSRLGDKRPEWAWITTDSPLVDNKKTCATELYYTFLMNSGFSRLIDDDDAKMKIGIFVEIVRTYDTFEFWEHFNELDPMRSDGLQLNNLFHILPKTEFIEYIRDYVNTSDMILLRNNDKYPWIEKVLELDNTRNLKYINQALSKKAQIPFKYTIMKNDNIVRLDYSAIVIFAEKNSSLIAKHALAESPEIELCFIVSHSMVGIYTSRSDLDVSSIAALFNGGGHKQAAGFTIPFHSATTFMLNHFDAVIKCAGSISSF